MATVVSFPGPGTPSRPVEPGSPADVVLIPSRLTKSRWLRREALRIAAGVGGASYVNVHRIILAERQRAGLSEYLARADADDALEHMRVLVAALDGWQRPPRRSGPDDGRAA